MSGAIAMGTNKITGLGDPTANQDAATKKYTTDTFLTISRWYTMTGAVDRNGSTSKITGLVDTTSASSDAVNKNIC